MESDEGECDAITTMDVRAILAKLRENQPTCVECESPALIRYYRDGKWRCDRHFVLAFHDDSGHWPGEE